MGGVSAVAALGGIGWGVWRERQAPPEVPAALWQMRFASPAGGDFSLASMRGKPLVLNFWASWCAPCVKELPQFERFHREFAPRGWQVVALAIDREEAVREFLTRVPLSFRIGLMSLQGAELMRHLGNRDGVLPYTVVLGADGGVLQRRRGETSYEELVRWATVSANPSTAAPRPTTPA
jgi:thiol-disulfide isomerase/thioredoxin